MLDAFCSWWIDSWRDEAGLNKRSSGRTGECVRACERSMHEKRANDRKIRSRQVTSSSSYIKDVSSTVRNESRLHNNNDNHHHFTTTTTNYSIKPSKHSTRFGGRSDDNNNHQQTLHSLPHSLRCPATNQPPTCSASASTNDSSAVLASPSVMMQTPTHRCTDMGRRRMHRLSVAVHGRHDA